MLPLLPSLHKIWRSNHHRCSIKKVFLEISQNSQEYTCARVSFFNKVAGLRPGNLFKKRLWHRCFPVNFVKLLRTPLLQNTSGRLLLIMWEYGVFLTCICPHTNRIFDCVLIQEYKVRKNPYSRIYYAIFCH